MSKEYYEYKWKQDSGISEYDSLLREGKISKVEYDWYKKFDYEYYERKYFENPINVDYKEEESKRVYRLSQAVKLDNAQYNELVGYCLSKEEYDEIHEDIKILGPEGHIWKHIQIKKDMLQQDDSPENIERCLKDLVQQTILATKYNRKFNRNEQDH